MLPVGPLMIEHRLIERMIQIMQSNVESINEEGKIDSAFVDTAVDFVRIYADRCHHGKEEDILFRDLAKKNISDEHQRIMQELIEEHKMGRKNVKNLLEAKEKYVRGDKDALKGIVLNMETLVKFYPKHIEKEDKQVAMLSEMHEFDRNMIHEKYTHVVEDNEKRN